MAGVTLDGVRKVYENGFVAVHNATFEVRDGELMVLVGPSGCGKSTLLRMIAGLERITAGRLSIGERIVNDVPARDRDIAMVFQNYALYPHMTVRENLAFGLRLRKFARVEIEARVARAARILGLDAVLDRRPAQLSGGQRQRVAVGRAMVRDPQVFLFDEPLSNLDAKLRVQMRREIAALHHRLSATMVYVTHDQTEAMTLGDRAVVLNAGRVQQIGTPLELYDHPANVFVAGFIGSPAMNLVRGRIARDGAPRFTAEAALQVPLSPELAEAAATAGADEVILGIRPEAIAVVPADSPTPTHAGRVPARLALVEPLGNETMIEATIPGASLVARLEPLPLPPPGSEIVLEIDGERAHLFHAESGERIE